MLYERDERLDVPSKYLQESQSVKPGHLGSLNFVPPRLIQSDCH